MIGINAPVAWEGESINSHGTTGASVGVLSSATSKDTRPETTPKKETAAIISPSFLFFFLSLSLSILYSAL